ncbi:MAG: hypothetical protein JO294_02790 [Alphaproteobacteria bacterium]|nr:hypothetical protein [Alphaproteobacteria bacterium]
MLTRGIAFAAACALTISAHGAFAADNGAYRFEIRGYVPVVCNATYEPNVSVGSDGTIALGAVAEFCNADHGYRVVAEYSGAADAGTLLVDGRSVSLGASGEAVIAEVSGPAILSRHLSYRPGTTTLTSLRIRLDAAV